LSILTSLSCHLLHPVLHVRSRPHSVMHTPSISFSTDAPSWLFTSFFCPKVSHCSWLVKCHILGAQFPSFREKNILKWQSIRHWPLFWVSGSVSWTKE
jgi:hypothetical protein